jgi:hypothetical protein
MATAANLVLLRASSACVVGYMSADRRADVWAGRVLELLSSFKLTNVSTFHDVQHTRQVHILVLYVLEELIFQRRRLWSWRAIIAPALVATEM